MSDRTLLQNASVITEEGDCIEKQDIFVEDGLILKICRTGEDKERTDLFRKDESCEVIDCSRYFVSPGMPNLHVHTAMNIFKGIAEDVTSDAWFNEMIWPYESRMEPEDIYIGTMLGIAEMIDHGVTVFADHYFGEEQVLKAVKETGIRCSIGPTVFGASPDFKDRLSAVSEFITHHRKDSDRIMFHMGAHSNYTCPAPTLGQIVDEAKRLSVPIHLHLSEEEAQVISSRKDTGMTPFAVMDAAGGFDCPVLIAHGLWIEEEDLKYLKDDTWFAFCPKTYMKLAMGRGGFFNVSDRVNYSFGTDGAASSNTLSPVEQACLFGLLEKFQRDDATVHPAKEIWQHLMQGHAAFSFGTGKMAEGAGADLVIWDLFKPGTFAFYDPVSAILYSSNQENVRYTMVRGEFLKYDGNLILDFGSILKEAEARQKMLLKRGRGKAEIYY